MHTIKICVEKRKTHKHRVKIFIWFGARLKISHMNPLKEQVNMP